MGAYLQFLEAIPDSSLLYEGTYSPGLVLLSVLIAMFAAYAALDVATRIGSADSLGAKALWLSIGSVAMGSGIWAMHFIGMLAFNLPCLVRYDPVVTMASMVPGVMASAVALYVISHRRATGYQLVVGGVLLGSGIGAMHYSGMAAMRMDALLRYDLSLFLMSIVVAVVLAILALWIKFVAQSQPKRLRPFTTPAAAAVMGCAVAGMHYTAMAAAYFIRWDDPDIDVAAFDPTFLAIAVTIVTGLLIALALASTVAHRHFEIARRLREEVIRRGAVEKELRKLTRAVEQSPAMVMITDRDGLIEYVNPRFTEITGYTAEEVLGRSPALLKSGETAPETYADLWKTISEGNEWHGEFHNRRKDGSMFWGAASISPITGSRGRTTHFLGLQEDVTERKAAEMELAAKSEQLASSNAELEQFAYVASHDLQEPLRTVSNYVQLLERRYPDRFTDEAGEYMAFVVDAAKRMRAQIKDLLEYSRVRNRPQETKVVDANLLVDVALANLHDAIRASRADISVEPLPYISADEGQMISLFQNLIGNGIKYRAPDRRPVIKVAAHRVDDHWVVSVADNGIGIDPEYHERIFVIFQRLHNREEFEGTGIGLAVCKRIVEGHGGHIWLNSELGKGTTLYFSVPVHETVDEETDNT